MYGMKAVRTQRQGGSKTPNCFLKVERRVGSGEGSGARVPIPGLRGNQKSRLVVDCKPICKQGYRLSRAGRPFVVQQPSKDVHVGRRHRPARWRASLHQFCRNFSSGPE